MADLKEMTYNEHLARTDYPIHELIRQRWSPRAFDPRPVEPEKLLSILEAARWAASSYNRQPWRFIIARKEMPQSYEDMLAVLNEGNRAWAKYAPVLGLTVAEHQREDGKANAYAEHDTGMALAHMALQATDLGLHMHMIAGFDKDKARETYRIPARFKPLTAFVIGYYGDPEQIPEGKRRHTAERTRRPLTETVFAGSWEQQARLLKEG